ncbi:methylenetetrahydrofolate reductase [Pelagibacteraceae bacterium]|nr:methylenetetrahydrofolate reductase [Pelagibacteraceae bacterium]
MSKQTLKIVKNFLKTYSIETTPNVYTKYGGFSDFLDKNHDVYITYLPDENSDNVVKTAKKLKEEGYEVIPHLPARTLVNEIELEKYVGELANKSGCSKILIIGGGGNQAGNIASTMDVLKSDLLSKFNYKFVGVAGHPEGSPDISNQNLDLAIKEKNNFAKNVDFKMYIATQFFFEAKSLIEWENHLTTLGNKLPIHAGIPGPASIKTLINYARSCGIGNSLRFISKQAFNLTKLATLSTPDKLIHDLANYLHTNQSSKLENIHFYAFGGMKKTADWLNQLNNTELIYNNKNQFEL